MIFADAGGYCSDLLLHRARCSKPCSKTGRPTHPPAHHKHGQFVSFGLYQAQVVIDGGAGANFELPGETVLQLRPASLVSSSYSCPYNGDEYPCAYAGSDCCVELAAVSAAAASDC